MAKKRIFKIQVNSKHNDTETYKLVAKNDQDARTKAVKKFLGDYNKSWYDEEEHKQQPGFGYDESDIDYCEIVLHDTFET